MLLIKVQYKGTMLETLSAALVKHLMYTAFDPERQIIFFIKKIY
jgi:hypothetical protein